MCRTISLTILDVVKLYKSADYIEEHFWNYSKAK